MLPLEYQCHVKYKDNILTGLPKLISYGYDDTYAWLITEYLHLTNLLDYMDDGDYLSEDEYPTFVSYLEFMITFFTANQLLCHTDFPLCITPDNIFFQIDEEGLSCYFLGLDTMLFPSYGELHPTEYYDTRYMAPEILDGEYAMKSISYSYSLAILSVLKAGFPLPVRDLHHQVSAVEMVKLVGESINRLNELGLPEPLSQQFSMFINPNPRERVVLMPNEEFEARRSMGMLVNDKASGLTDEEQIKMMMNMSNINPFDNCFSRPRGRGLFDVGGMKNAKKEVQSIVGAIRHREYAESQSIGVQNILLLGPPGVGKSFFASKLSEELDLPYFLAHTSDLVGNYHGESARNIRNLFNEAEKKAPCLMILDEFDCVAQKRNVEMSPGAAESCNELLSQINECNKKGILIVATTNSINNVDPAILRSKRFDRKIYIGYPDNEEKEDILRCTLRSKPNSLKDEDYRSLVTLMEHFVGADIALAVENVSHDLLVEYGNKVFMSFFKTLDEDSPEKLAYLQFIRDEHDSVSENSFYTWCRVNEKYELKEAYIKYSAEKDKETSPEKITYEMLEKAIKNCTPSSTRQQEREYAQIYRDFLPEKKKAQARIGFVMGDKTDCAQN